MDAKKKLFLAFKGMDHEGIYEDSMRLFINRKDAEKYIEDLKSKDTEMFSQNFYEIKELELE